MKGKIVTWNKEKGFGFIQLGKPHPDVFAHVSEFNNSNRQPMIGDLVSFELKRRADGKFRANKILFDGESLRINKGGANAKKIKRRKKPKNRRTGLRLPVLLSSVYFSVLCFLVIFGGQSLHLLVAHLILSFFAFLAYARDKDSARQNRWRISENSLHLLSLFGGWPGALIAQRKFRHKTSKKSFQMIFWLTVLLSLWASTYLHTSDGRQLLQKMNILLDKSAPWVKPKAQIEWSNKNNN